MKYLKLAIIGVFTFILTSCGGGGGGTSGGGQGGVLFFGTGFITYRATGFLDQNISVPITFSVTATTVTVTFPDGNTGTAPLSADGVNFSVPVNLQFAVSKEAFSCQGGDLIHTGTINGVNISGTFSGVIPCIQGSLPIAFTASGTFTASQ